MTAVLLAIALAATAPEPPPEAALAATPNPLAPHVGPGHLTLGANATFEHVAVSTGDDLLEASASASFTRFVDEHLALGALLGVGTCSLPTCGIGIRPGVIANYYQPVAPDWFAVFGATAAVGTLFSKTAPSAPLLIFDADAAIGAAWFVRPWLAFEPELYTRFTTNGGNQVHLGLRAGLRFYL